VEEAVIVLRAVALIVRGVMAIIRVIIVVVIESARGDGAGLNRSTQSLGTHLPAAGARLLFD
jgi:hypothetical protein